MKSIIICFLTVCCLAFIGCEESPTESVTKIINRCGIVDLDGSVRNGNDSYHFDYKDAFSFGFSVGDNVCFEAEYNRYRSSSNNRGGTTYWCKLISMSKN